MKKRASDTLNHKGSLWEFKRRVIINALWSGGMICNKGSKGIENEIN